MFSCEQKRAKIAPPGRLLPLLCLVLLGGRQVCGALTLASAGATDYVVVVDPSASAADRHAAGELAAFLGQVSGAPFPVIETETPAAGPMLVVGRGAVQRALAPALDADALGPDGIVIETVGRSLVFAGDPPRGTLYAVYTFLEDAVGCRWWTSQASTIPSRRELSVPEQRVRYTPPLAYREPFFWDAFDGDFAARNKCNGASARLEARHGGRFVVGPSDCHTFFLWLPPAKYAAEHPEYYAERGGQRTGRGQLCLTSAGMRRELAAQALAYLAANPGVDILEISQQDTEWYCQCAECKRQAEEEGGTMAGPLLHTINAVAAAVAAKHPDVAIRTFAYKHTRKPPLHVKPLPNVIVRLCSVECDFATPLSSASNRKFAADLEGWGRICRRLHVWDYTANFNNYIMPYPNVRVLAPNVRLFVAHGVTGIFEQNAYTSPGADMAELKAWMLAKLLWNPQLDDRALMDAFLAGYYGPAAPPIREYLNLLGDSAERAGTFLPITLSASGAGYLTLDLMAKAEALFRQAEAAVADNPALLNRVQVARLPIRFVWAARWHAYRDEARRNNTPFPGPADFAANIRTFAEVCRTNRITMVSESLRTTPYLQSILSLNRADSPPPPGLAEGAFIDLQDDSCLGADPAFGVATNDPAASDGVAVRMPGSHFEWAYQQQLAVTGGTYSIFVSVRVEKSGAEGNAFSAGVYDLRQPRFVTEIVKTAGEITDTGYVTYKVGTEPLHNRSLLWVAPPKNPDNITAVWVDRFWLVKE